MKVRQDISYKPIDAWVGDVIPYYENGTYYIYYLHDPRKNGEGVYAEETTWHLVTTEDGFDFKEHGKSLRLGNETSPYQNIYTGSVIKATDNKYYAFFTAFNSKHLFEGKPVQSIMRAVGDTLDNLEIDENFRLLADNNYYQMHDWRDPYLFFNEDEQCYWMLVSSRARDTSSHRGGCLALCKSYDLDTWSYEEPFYAPNMFGGLECPELFKLNGWYYLIFSTYSDRFVTHYRKSKNVNGPWDIPYEDSLDCRANYAIKTAGSQKERLLFGWIATKCDGNDYGHWEWGGTMISHELIQNSRNGDLHVKPIEALDQYFSESTQLSKPAIINATYDESLLVSEGLGALLFSFSEKQFSIRASLELENPNSEFGILLNSDVQLDQGYQLRIMRNMVAWDWWPRIKESGLYQWQIHGDIPFQIETARYLQPAKNYELTLYRSGEIVLIYVNNEVVLSTRLYNVESNLVGLYVVNGGLKIDRFEIMLPE
jgi:beta-fructofuranosidase